MRMLGIYNMLLLRSQLPCCYNINHLEYASTNNTKKKNKVRKVRYIEKFNLYMCVILNHEFV